MQQEQLAQLNQMTGVNFHFVPADKSPMGLKYYEHKCVDGAEYQKLAGAFNQYDDLPYFCLEHDDGSCSMLVMESELDVERAQHIMWDAHLDKNSLKPIGKINGNDVYLDLLPAENNVASPIVNYHGRALVVVNINGRHLPFYVSSGMAGKDKMGIPSGKWYALQGISESGWLNKMPDMLHNPYPELDQICALLETVYPATKMKQAALDSGLPAVVDMDALLKYSNHDFLDGMPRDETGTIKHRKNHEVYLPKIIQAWRGQPTDYLDSVRGPMMGRAREIAQLLQKYESRMDISNWDDLVWFTPKESHQNNEDLIGMLGQRGIDINTVITSDNRSGFGAPVHEMEEVVKTLQDKAQQPFRVGAQELKAVNKKSIFGTIADMFKNNRGE